MIVLKDCPNCGSFDIIAHPETDEFYAYMSCNSCGSDWVEGETPNHASVVDFDHETPAGVGFDLADDDYEYEPPNDVIHVGGSIWEDIERRAALADDNAAGHIVGADF
jgi:hypothetical protein